MAQLAGNPKPGYTISLFVSRKTEAHDVTEGQYDTRTFPADTRELARVELRGEDLEKLLTKARVHMDQIEEV